MRTRAVLLAAAITLYVFPALGQGFSGPAVITQPTTAGRCVQIAPQGGNNIVQSSGPCGTGTAPSPANPTATIGAAAVNGAATTYMRSDAAPALPATLPALSGVNLTALNATNLGSGTVPIARLPTGTSGATLPQNSTANVFSAAQSINLNATALPTAQTGTELQIANLDAVAPRIELDPYGTSGFFSAVRRSGTAASPTQVLSGEQIGGFNAFALTNTATIVGPIASFRTYAAENITATANGSKACVATVLSTTTTLTDNLCVNNDGSATLVGAMNAPNFNATTGAALPRNGVYLSTTDTPTFTSAGVARWMLTPGSGALSSMTNGGAMLGTTAASTTNPTLRPRNDTATLGWGAGTTTTLDAIIGGVNVWRLGTDGVRFLGTIPTVTGTGTPTITTGSTDSGGEVTAGSAATSVVISFSATKTNAPFCNVTPQTQLATFSYVISTSAITITQVATSGDKIDYTCLQH